MKIEEHLFSVEEVAERLGMSRYTIAEWLRSGRLTGRRIGRFWRVRESDLEAFIANPPPLERSTPAAAAAMAEEASGDQCAQIRAALVALLHMLLPEGERRYLRDFGITALPLVPLNALLAHEGYVIEAYEVQDPTRFVDCLGQDGVPEPFGLFEMRRLTTEG
jgi:excisionase family DNA binding protein